MLSIVTIYNRPKDYPDSFVARRFTIGPNTSFPTRDYVISPDIQSLREWAQAQCLKFNAAHGVNMGRQLTDEPHIVESWI
jgi:hypothetical protein